MPREASVTSCTPSQLRVLRLVLINSFLLTTYQSPVQDGITPLYAAAQEGHLKIVEMLVAAKCQVDLQEEVSQLISLYASCISASCCVILPCTYYTSSTLPHITLILLCIATVLQY